MYSNRRQMLGGAAVMLPFMAGSVQAKTACEGISPRSFPIPSTASPELQALIATPVGSQWRLTPASKRAWHEIVDASTVVIEKRIADWPKKYGVTVREDRIGGVRVYWVLPDAVPKDNRERLLVNFHGGAYVFAPARSGLEDAILMASRGFRVVTVDYRMAPDFPYPAAIDDAETVWRHIAEKVQPRRLGVFGTSTGGGMTLALIHRAKRRNLPLPGAIWAGTPWSDLTETGDSYFTNRYVDDALVSYKGILGAAARAYAGGHDMRDPELSPVYGDFSYFPPTILTTGTRDLFLSNTVRVHRKLRDAGIPAELTVIEALSHAQYVALPNSRESRQVYGDVANFFSRTLSI